MFIWSIALIPCFFLMVSCGAQRNFPDYQDGPVSQREEQKGFYQADLFPLNTHRSEKTYGHAYFHAEDNQFYARINMKSNAVGISHRQYIHEGGNCPDRLSDLNKDRVVDSKEVLNVSGKMLIPLDSDVSSQNLGNVYPVIKEDFQYEYSEAGPLDVMMDDLRDIDQDETDYLIKIRPEQELNLSKRVIVVYVPSLVATNDGDFMKNWVPVACGKINQRKDKEEFLF